MKKSLFVVITVLATVAITLSACGGERKVPCPPETGLEGECRTISTNRNMVIGKSEIFLIGPEYPAMIIWWDHSGGAYVQISCQDVNLEANGDWSFTVTLTDLYPATIGTCVVEPKICPYGNCPVRVEVDHYGGQ